jgi:hypothetical protein
MRTLSYSAVLPGLFLVFASAMPGFQNDPAPASFRPVVNQYCVPCHNERAKTAGLMLDKLDLANIPASAEVWEKIIRKVNGNAMPPVGMPHPDAATTTAFLASLQTVLDRASAEHPNPGQPLLHRFNRAEYANAIRDLLALDVDVSSLLPPDDSSSGFDNNADVLGVSPLLMERYVSAAEQISALAVGDASIKANSELYRLPHDLTQSDHIEGLPIGTRGGAVIHREFPVDGDYVIRTKLLQSSVGFVRGLQSAHDVEISLDGKRVLLASVGGLSDYQVNVVNPLQMAAEINGRLRLRLHITGGPHDLAVTFIKIAGGWATGPEAMGPFLSTEDPLYVNGLPSIDTVTIEGPYNPSVPRETPSRKAIFTCKPASAAEEATCARSILSRLSRRAWRRPVTDVDLQPIMRLYQTGRRENNFDSGIELALQGVLTSPAFLFRSEQDPAGLAAGDAHRVGDLDLASRLSFFLWSSIPDEELLKAAADGQLHDPAVLERQVRRMLADKRSEALASNFGGQWLQLRNLPGKVPIHAEFSDFDENLRESMRRETELLLASVIHEDRNILDLLTANYTFLDERLARHYGFSGVYGSDFRRVELTDPNRFGLLGQGSILTVTSYPNRTSPVVRGRWILENVLGTPPPPPPPNVPALNESGKAQTVRERMAAHRASPACASCHRIMDPLGFALENFDATGAWRIKDSGFPIDPSDTLADGTKVDGPAALRQALLRRPDMFVGTVTQKLMTYALGRGIQYYDMPAVRKVEHDAALHDDRFSSIVLGIVNSVPFQMRAKPAGDGALPPAADVVAAR